MTDHDAPAHRVRSGRPPSPEELKFVRDARIGRLATVDDRNRPSVVPFCFAVVADTEPVVVSVLDEKPKRVADRDLARIRNIRHQPEVMFVIDEYDEDWSRLAFVQVRGLARVIEPSSEGHDEAVEALREKYPQYRTMAIERRAVIVIQDLRVASWRGDGRSFATQSGTGGPETAELPL